MSQEPTRPPVTVTSPGTPAGGDLLTDRQDRLPGRWRAPRGAVVAVVGLLVVAGIAGWLVSRGGVKPARAERVRPSPTHVTPAAAPLGTARSISHDLTTTVSVGHVRIRGKPVAQQMSAVSRAIGAGIEGSAVYLPDSYFGHPGALSPDGVLVQFDRELSVESARAFARGIAQLGTAQGTLLSVPGTTVDVGVPVRPEAACAGGTDEQLGALLLSPADAGTVGRVLRVFNPQLREGFAVVGYTGPYLTAAQLAQVGRALAHSCEEPAGAVTYTRRIEG